jgi:hypothetical protein
MRAYRSGGGFEADAGCFDLIAGQTIDRDDWKQWKQVADTYRSLAKDETPVGTRQSRWEQRAAQCRKMAAEFKGEACRVQLLRLADTYDVLAVSNP